eukprot:scaffold126699_cov36-Tisochrysis_lutea.AAC.1
MIYPLQGDYLCFTCRDSILHFSLILFELLVDFALHVFALIFRDTIGLDGLLDLINGTTPHIPQCRLAVFADRPSGLSQLEAPFLGELRYVESNYGSIVAWGHAYVAYHESLFHITESALVIHIDN